jgi:hypothetical protein
MTTQMIFGQTDALALAVASWLNTNNGTFCLPVVGKRRFVLIDTQLPDIERPVQVDVFPDVEVSDRQGISTAFNSHYAVHLFIQQRLTRAGVGESVEEDEQCALLAELRSQIIEGIKKRMFQLTNAVTPVGNVFLWQVKNADHRGLYDLGRLLEQHVFASDTILVFKAAV